MSLRGFTVYDMICRNALILPDSPAIIHEGGTVSFREYLQRVDALATGLAGHSIQKGERVCILAYNHAAYLELYGACAKLGLISYPINWRLTEVEIERIVDRASPRMMVVDEHSLGLIAGWPGKKKEIPFWYQIGSTPGEGFTPLDNLYVNSGADNPPEALPDDPFTVIVTAAVDVIPRGAVLTHANIIASNAQSMALMGLEKTDRYLLALPLYHISALGNALAVMHAGGANILMERFEPEKAVELIDAHQATFITGFAPVLSNLLDAAEKCGSKLPSLRHAQGLETPEAIKRLKEITKAQFWSGFGQAETTGFVTLQKLEDCPGGVGRPAPLCQIKLVDQNERAVPVLEAGEILVRGPIVMQGYFGQPDETAHTFRGGWHHTGDLGRFDENGFLHYTGRKPEKELIKPGGENVYPAEVETVIKEIKGVMEACVFGVADDQWGEAIMAVVETPPDSGLTDQGIIDYVGGRIARFKRPKWVEFTTELPKTSSGEIDRAKVKSRWGQPG